MTKGTVKWFNPVKGYGFISPEDGSKDAFVHISAVERAGLNELREGQVVEFELQQGPKGRFSAENLKVADETWRAVDEQGKARFGGPFRFRPSAAVPLPTRTAKPPSRNRSAGPSGR